MGISMRHGPLILRIAAWLGMAAAPIFAAMAILTSSLNGDGMRMICGAEPSALAGMAPMYLLMSVFHSIPWLKLIGDRLSRERGRAME
jgi:hypothetical protein